MIRKHKTPFLLTLIVCLCISNLQVMARSNVQIDNTIISGIEGDTYDDDDYYDDDDDYEYVDNDEDDDWDDDWDDDDWDDDEEDDDPYSVVNPGKLFYFIGGSQKSVVVGKTLKLRLGIKTKELSKVKKKIPNFKYKVSWNSSNKNVATVNKKGKIKTKKIGKATISALIDYGDDAYYSVDFKLTVAPKNVKYTKIKGILKSKVKAKAFSFKEKNKGENSQLFGQYYDSDNIVVSDEYYVERFLVFPYISLEKKGKTSVTKLKLQVTGIIGGVEKDTRTYTRLSISHSGKELICYGKTSSTYKKEKGYWYTTYKGSFTIASSDNFDATKFKKLQKIFSSKKFTINLDEGSDDDAYVWCEFTKSNNTSQLINYYKSCLKEYGIK